MYRGETVGGNKKRRRMSVVSRIFHWRTRTLADAATASPEKRYKFPHQIEKKTRQERGKVKVYSFRESTPGTWSMHAVSEAHSWNLQIATELFYVEPPAWMYKKANEWVLYCFFITATGSFVFSDRTRGRKGNARLSNTPHVLLLV